MSNPDLALSVALGIGLAAATGFRLFLPLLILSGAAYTGHVSLNESFAWLGTPAAIIMLGTAAIAEIAAFYIPGVDNLPTDDRSLCLSHFEIQRNLQSDAITVS